MSNGPLRVCFSGVGQVCLHYTKDVLKCPNVQLP